MKEFKTLHQSTQGTDSTQRSDEEVRMYMRDGWEIVEGLCVARINDRVVALQREIPTPAILDEKLHYINEIARIDLHHGYCLMDYQDGKWDLCLIDDEKTIIRASTQDCWLRYRQLIAHL